MTNIMPETIQDIIILFGGELSSDVAADLQSKLEPVFGSKIQQVAMGKSKLFKTALLEDKNIAKPTTLAIFVVSTIENESPPEDAGACVRFFKRRTHPADLLADKVQFAVLGLGDSNLLLDRQHTAAKDCNQVAQALDGRLEALGGKRFCYRGEADERTGLTEIDPWIEALIRKLKN
jgi:sulfite reductase alpha subunit-like flavoprotein